MARIAVFIFKIIQWKYFQNRLIVDEVIAKSSIPRFHTVYFCMQQNDQNAQGNVSVEKTSRSNIEGPSFPDPLASPPPAIEISAH